MSREKMWDSVTKAAMDRFTDKVGEALAELLEVRKDVLDLNDLSQYLQEYLLRPCYGVRVVEDEDAAANDSPSKNEEKEDA